MSGLTQFHRHFKIYMFSSALFIFLFFISVVTSKNVPEQFVKIEHIEVGFLFDAIS